MTKGKNYNRIVFLTTLSVYLGLVLVGATPQVLAQTGKQAAEKNKISILVPSEGYVFTFDLNPFIELDRLASKETSPTKVSGKLVPLHQEHTNWETIIGTGNQKIINFLRKEFFTAMVMNPPTQPLFAKELFQSVEIDKDSITITRNTVFSEVGKAAHIADIFRRMSGYAKSNKADKEIAGNLYLTNTEARAENNQVFIVTRLPRAGIDSHLE